MLWPLSAFCLLGDCYKKKISFKRVFLKKGKAILLSHRNPAFWCDCLYLAFTFSYTMFNWKTNLEFRISFGAVQFMQHEYRDDLYVLGKQAHIRIDPVTMRSIKHINGYISLNGHIQRSSLTPSLAANLLLWQDWEVLRGDIILSPCSKHPLPSLSSLLLTLPAVGHFYCIYCTALTAFLGSAGHFLSQPCQQFLIRYANSYIPLTRSQKHHLNVEFYHNTQIIKIQISPWYKWRRK